ncbi:MAG: SDH family Clp fold serine proteinase [Armatimonadota bacterium]
MDYISQIFWLIILLSFMLPGFKQRMLDSARLRLIHLLEKKRGSRVITLIHRQEQMALFGIPFFRYINIDDSEQVLRAIRLTPPELPIDLILHTPGGLVLASEQIAMALRAHEAPVSVFVPHYAMSGGTMIALAANHIVMDKNAVLGPVDPQLGEYPAVSILKAVEAKPVSEVDDRTLIYADIARKAIDQVKCILKYLLAEKFDEAKAEELASTLCEGRWTHDYPITVDELQQMGIPVSTDVPPEVYDLMDLYPQPAQRRPSVEYIPLPYTPPTVPPRSPAKGDRP